MKAYKAVDQIKEKFGSSIIGETKFCGEISLEMTKEKFKDALIFLKNAPDPGFEVLMDLTGVDYLEPTARTKVVYWLHNPVNFERIRINVFANRDETLPTVVDLWEGADWYEREIFDLFGVRFRGHPELKRILMPDEWKGHPLRRDYALTEESVEFKHGVAPKIPSKIIPYVKSTQKS